MEVDSSTVRRLVFWNRFWLALVLVGMLLWAAPGLFTRSNLLPLSLRVAWQSDGGLALVTWSDGPFIVTHLTVRYGPSEAQKAVAELPSPVAIIDSEGASIPPQVLKTLTWKNPFGKTLTPPGEGTPVHALYYRPLSTP
jgi:hypothetical protein